jgi:ribonuclease HI
MTLYTLFFDGCCKGNPGPGGAGALLYDAEGNEIWSQNVYVGEKTTNNIAEYTGLVIGLQEAVKREIKHLQVKGDSLLAIKQMRGEYKVNSENIRGLFLQAKELEKQFANIIFIHVYRKDNSRADDLSNQGLVKQKMYTKDGV